MLKYIQSKEKKKISLSFTIYINNEEGEEIPAFLV
jgi:hypothetical protein